MQKLTSGTSQKNFQHAALILPHAHEAKVTVPVARILHARLETEGVIAKKYSLNMDHYADAKLSEANPEKKFGSEKPKKLIFGGMDTQKKGWAIRSEIGESGEWQNTIISNLLAFDDYATRAGVLNYFFEKKKEGVAIELHAVPLNRWFNRKERGNLEEPGNRKKLDEANIYALDNTAANIALELGKAMDFLRSLSRIGDGFAKKIGEIIGIKQAIWENPRIERMIETLIGHNKSVKCIEIPSIASSLAESHPLFGHYFVPGSTKTGDFKFSGINYKAKITVHSENKISDFEDIYCTQILLPLHEKINDSRIDAIVGYMKS